MGGFSHHHPMGIGVAKRDGSVTLKPQPWGRDEGPDAGGDIAASRD